MSTLTNDDLSPLIAQWALRVGGHTCSEIALDILWDSSHEVMENHTYETWQLVRISLLYSGNGEEREQLS